MRPAVAIAAAGVLLAAALPCPKIRINGNGHVAPPARKDALFKRSGRH